MRSDTFRHHPIVPLFRLLTGRPELRPSLNDPPIDPTRGYPVPFLLPGNYPSVPPLSLALPFPPDGFLIHPVSYHIVNPVLRVHLRAHISYITLVYVLTNTELRFDRFSSKYRYKNAMPNVLSRRYTTPNAVDTLIVLL
ncbi:hypothetical protein OE88DRAFT_1651934 [Heliocybe sulcata]|uniref:Uncharacterized protein n=1 Tax=Heliocybe sulcata TaxID=5364 RepID=A0A5C3NF80_9AGAM|nr:hypothetical protein OE88DRAFT_1651934 [Heliocybe sulcata]